MRKPLLLMSTSLILAGSAGFLASQALSSGSSAQATTTTVTIQNGATGPAGPQGPPGPAGNADCPKGFSQGELVINHPGGQTTIWTCLK